MILVESWQAGRFQTNPTRIFLTIPRKRRKMNHLRGLSRPHPQLRSRRFRCDMPVLRKIFAHPKPKQWTILDKDVVDEMIFRTANPGNRLILEPMARNGMRIGEVLALRAEDIEDRRVSLTNPKSGKESERVFLPQKVAERLKAYIIKREIRPDEKIFPITYSAARDIVRKAGMLLGVKVSPHDLRRHAATYASRAGKTIEIVSKLILRHSNRSTTQRYLGRISDVEALRWIDNLHG